MFVKWLMIFGCDWSLHRSCRPAGVANSLRALRWRALRLVNTFCVFLDADVRLHSFRLVADGSSSSKATEAELVSGFPHQEVHSFYERLLLPLMHFPLLGFLPMDLMRRSIDPSLGAG